MAVLWPLEASPSACMMQGAGYLSRAHVFFRGKPPATERSVGKREIGNFSHKDRFRFCPTATLQQFQVAMETSPPAGTESTAIVDFPTAWSPSKNCHFFSAHLHWPPITVCTCIRCQRRNHVQADQGTDMAGWAWEPLNAESSHCLQIGFSNRKGYLLAFGPVKPWHEIMKKRPNLARCRPLRWYWQHHASQASKQKEKEARARLCGQHSHGMPDAGKQPPWRSKPLTFHISPKSQTMADMETLFAAVQQFRYPVDPSVGFPNLVSHQQIHPPPWELEDWKKRKAVESMEDHFKRIRGLRHLRSNLRFS